MPNKGGQTPLDLATNTEIIQLLQEKTQIESQIPTKPDNSPNRFVTNEDKRRKL